MTTKLWSGTAKWSRRMPDPNIEGAETHFILMPASALPDGLPLDANPREPQVNRPVYRAVANSLREEDDSVDGTFHLKHRGITLVASAVTKRHDVDRDDGLDELELRFPAEGMFGIADGGHSYEIIRQAREAGAIPDDQFIKLEVITGLPESYVVDIVGGRNTSMQVQTKSLLDLEGEFKFLKDLLEADGWADRVAWHEGDDGDLDIVDVIAILSCFDIAGFPDRSKHPVDAYRRKKSMLERFQADVDRYKRLSPIIRDILYLHDWIAYDSEGRWQEIGGVSGGGGKYGRLDMVENRSADGGRSKPPFTFPFLPGVTSEKRLRRPAVFPILASFRLLVTEDSESDPTGPYRPVMWRKDFDEVRELWGTSGGQLLRTFYEHWPLDGPRSA